MSQGTVLGYVGLGQIGAPFARHLAAAGHHVHAFDRDAEARDRLEGAAGIELSPTLEDVVEAADLLFTCLPTPAAVEAVYASVAKPGLIACDNSTVGPALAKRLHADLAGRGIAYVECPVLGSAADAAAGRLFLLLSGDGPSIARVLPFALSAARDHRVVGGTGMASLYKTAQNGLGLVQLAAIAEALALVARAGGDLESFVEVVTAGGGMAASPLFASRAAAMIEPERPAHGQLHIAAKDSALAAGLAAECGLELPLFARADQLFAAALAAGLGEADLSAVARIVERESGTGLRAGERA